MAGEGIKRRWKLIGRTNGPPGNESSAIYVIDGPEIPPHRHVNVMPVEDHLDTLGEAQLEVGDLRVELQLAESSRVKAEDALGEVTNQRDFARADASAEREAAMEAEGKLAELRGHLQLVIEQQEMTATNAGSETISLGAEGSLDGEREAKLIEVIACNTLRDLNSLAALLDQPPEECSHPNMTRGCEWVNCPDCDYSWELS